MFCLQPMPLQPSAYLKHPLKQCKHRETCTQASIEHHSGNTVLAILFGDKGKGANTRPHCNYQKNKIFHTLYPAYFTSRDGCTCEERADKL